jgi:Lipocalin-like domain
MHTRLVLVTVLLLGSAVNAPTQTSPKGLVGTWQLVSRIDRDPAGRVVAEPSIGSDPLGYLIYDSTGHVAVQLMARNRTSAPCVTTAAADLNNVAHIGGYDAYFGRYEVDMQTGTVTHILDGALSPGDVGRRITRRFRLEGDTLTIEFEPGGQGKKRIRRSLIWRRVSA